MHRAGDVASAANGVHPATVRDALAAYATPAPPPLDEPTEWGARVTDAEGKRWLLSHPDLGVVTEFARGLSARADPLRDAGAELWGPAPAPIARIRGRHRVRMLIRAPRQAPVQDAIRRWLTGIKLPTNLRLAVDIDPQSFL